MPDGLSFLSPSEYHPALLCRRIELRYHKLLPSKQKTLFRANEPTKAHKFKTPRNTLELGRKRLAKASEGRGECLWKVIFEDS